MTSFGSIVVIRITDVWCIVVRQMNSLGSTPRPTSQPPTTPTYRSDPPTRDVRESWAPHSVTSSADFPTHCVIIMSH